MRPTRVLLPLLLACTATAGAQTITGAEIQDTWVGKEVHSRAPSGARVIMTMNADGSAKLLIGSMPDTGTWRPWEQGYCAAWKGLRGGQEMCFSVRREGDRIAVYRPDGSQAGLVELR